MKHDLETNRNNDIFRAAYVGACAAEVPKADDEYIGRSPKIGNPVYRDTEDAK